MRWIVMLLLPFLQVLNLQGLGGVHFMPLGPKSHELAKGILKRHLLPNLLNVDETIQPEERPD